MDTILIFQGGGSLGAYEREVYQALSPWLREKGHRLAVGQLQMTGNWNVWALRDRVLFQDKGEYDKRSADWVNRHIDFVREVRRHIHSMLLPERGGLDELAALVERAASVMVEEGRLRLNIQRIVRSDANRNEVSLEIDFSPTRIGALMIQGQADATASIATL